MQWAVHSLKHPLQAAGHGLYEARGLTTGVRLFFVFAPGQRIVVLDGYVKKRTSIPARIMARIRRLQADTERALRNEDGKNGKI